MKTTKVRKKTNVITDILVNSMEYFTQKEFLNLQDTGYNMEQLQTIWLRYWALSGEDRFHFDSYHYEQTILKNL